MRVGSKSILFGAHCFFIHPWFVALASWRLYGFPWDLRLWVAFFVHDLGYWGKPNMDGPEGETHPELGGRIMGWLFDIRRRRLRFMLFKWRFGLYIWRVRKGLFWKLSVRSWIPELNTWENFTKYHSRSYARKHGADFSKLCVADKLAITLTPAWIYIPLATLSGEIAEYMVGTKDIKLEDCFNNHVIRFELQSGNKKIWLRGLKYYMREWVKENNRFVSINA